MKIILLGLTFLLTLSTAFAGGLHLETPVTRWLLGYAGTFPDVRYAKESEQSLGCTIEYSTETNQHQVACQTTIKQNDGSVYTHLCRSILPQHVEAVKTIKATSRVIYSAHEMAFIPGQPDRICYFINVFNGSQFLR